MTSTICMQMRDHGGLKASLIMDGGEEETISRVWMLQSIHTNFVRLTHRVPMEQVEGLPEAMQRQVVGVP